MLAVVMPAASASAFRRPNLLNDASHRAAAAQTQGFLPAKTLLFFSRSSTAALTTEAGRPTLAATVPTYSSMEGLLLCLTASLSLHAAFLTLRSSALLHLRKSSSGLGAPAAFAVEPRR